MCTVYGLDKWGFTVYELGRILKRFRGHALGKCVIYLKNTTYLIRIRVCYKQNAVFYECKSMSLWSEQFIHMVGVVKINRNGFYTNFSY